MTDVDGSPDILECGRVKFWILHRGDRRGVRVRDPEAPERLARFVRAYGSVPALQAANARVDLRYASGLALRGVFVKPVVRHSLSPLIVPILMMSAI